MLFKWRFCWQWVNKLKNGECFKKDESYSPLQTNNFYFCKLYLGRIPILPKNQKTPIKYLNIDTYKITKNNILIFNSLNIYYQKN